MFRNWYGCLASYTTRKIRAVAEACIVYYSTALVPLKMRLT